MALDKRSQRANTKGMPPICRALRQAFLESPLTQTEVARRINTEPANISRWVNGLRVPEDLETIAALDKAFGEIPGYLLRLAGYVEDLDDPEGVIQTDTRLTPTYRQVVLDTYDAAVERSAESRASEKPRAKSSPTAPKRRA